MMLKQKSVLFLLFSLIGILLAGPTQVQAQNLSRIAAVVNDEVISAHDLAHRVLFTIITGRLPNTPEVRNRLSRQILQGMIDDRLKLQEAERMGIEITKEQIEGGLKGYAQGRNFQLDQFDLFLKEAGIDRGVLEEQAKASIAWVFVVRRDSRERVIVTDSEVDRELARIEENKGKPEYRYSEIFLPVEKPSDEASILDQAQRLLGHLENGAEFSAIASDFSQSISAGSGGALGWVLSGTISNEIENTLSHMQEGQVSQPIKTGLGYYIVKLEEKRIAGVEKLDETIHIAQAVFPVENVSNPASWDEQNSKAIQFLQTVDSCTSLLEQGKTLGGARVGKVENIRLSGLADELRTPLTALQVGQSTVIRQERGAFLAVMMCERVKDEPELEIVKRRTIEQQLLTEKVEREGRRILQRLKRDAIVDIRL